MIDAPDLLELRLDALDLDVGKVRRAVDHAQARGGDLGRAQDTMKRVRSKVKATTNVVQALAQAVAASPEIGRLVDEESDGLSAELQRVGSFVTPELAGYVDTIDGCLQRATRTAVSLDDEALQVSLDRKCQELQTEIGRLREEVSSSGHPDRAHQWRRYQALLEGRARPLFAEYVDFLGGLTVRDVGLDDRVCEMTDTLLIRFKLATRRSLPLPARQAALGSALESVILLGFPEWSIWGIPLVGHEVGLAYVEECRDEAVEKLVAGFAEAHTDRSALFLRRLVADVFATHTLGISYACAALLLRLSPRHGDPADRDQPTDLDRARVILYTLVEAGSHGASFTDAVDDLQRVWLRAVEAHAGPSEAEAAVREAEGPPPTADWLDDLAREALASFGQVPLVIRAYDHDRWTASLVWATSLAQDAGDVGWEPVEDAVLDVLTAAWRLRLGWSEAGPDGPPGPDALAAAVKARWSQHRGVSS